MIISQTILLPQKINKIYLKFLKHALLRTPKIQEIAAGRGTIPSQRFKCGFTCEISLTNYPKVFTCKRTVNMLLRKISSQLFFNFQVTRKILRKFRLQRNSNL